MNPKILEEYEININHTIFIPVVKLSICPDSGGGAGPARQGQGVFQCRQGAEAREYTLKAMEMRKALFGEVNEDYTLEYYRMVVTFYEEKDSEAARKNIAMCHKGMGNIMI